MNTYGSSLALGAVLILGSACTQSPASPSVQTPAVVSTTAVTVTSAPQTGQSFQLTAVARMSDGANKDVTSQALWESSNPSLATVSTAGLMTVAAAGGVSVRATYQTVVGTLQLLVLGPPVQATFELSGVVTEVAPGSKALAGVQLRITAGPDTGMSTTTDPGGQFRFAGLSPGVIAFEVSEVGYTLWRVTNLTMNKDYRQWDVVLFPTPARNQSNETATMRCNDGTWSWAQTVVDACTANGGPAYPVCPGLLCFGSTPPSAQ